MGLSGAGGVVAAVTDEAFDRVRAAAPGGVEVLPLAEALDRATFLVPTGGDALGDVARLTELRVVQTLSAGTDWIETELPPWVTLCNARGTRDVPMAEWVIGALLAAWTGLLGAARARSWEHVRPLELRGRRIVVVGHGSIGRAVAERLEPFGAVVDGVGRRPREGVHGAEALPDLLPLADAVVVLLPLSEETRRTVDAEWLGRLRDGALFVNAGRGAVVDTDALLAELSSGRLRAVLDVADPEPLPGDHPLWGAPGLLALTSHQAGDSQAADERAYALAADQLGRFARGEPLLNIVHQPQGV